MPERRITGEPASLGIAIGPLVRLADSSAEIGRRHGDPAAERAALDAALAAAQAELAGLAATADDLAREILEFQIEMLGDPALVAEAAEAIAGGAPAGAAWAAALAGQIVAFGEAEDEYFRARAGDLADLRDRVLGHLADGASVAAQELPSGAILVAHDLGPSRFLGLGWERLGGLALEGGSRTSHLAMLARARGVPLVTGLGRLPVEACDAVLDAGRGLVVLGPEPDTLARYRAERSAAGADDDPGVLARPAVTRSGERLSILLNVDDPAALDPRRLAASDGIGLVRSEFLFLGRNRPPDEAAQLAAYKALLEAAGGRPVTVRTLDIGGDKPLPGVSLPHESNPFLGLRGIRLCLERPELFRPQVRALLRAAVRGNLKVMLPMVAHPDELAEARELFTAELAGLQREGHAAAMPALGIMVEVPAVAVLPERFAAADFLSIGSNDLIQYTLAAARDAAGRVARLALGLDPAVARLIANVVAFGRDAGKEVSVCGDLASEPDAVNALLDLGVRQLSVAPAALGRIKAAIAAYG
jgi:phosphotransferase system enzyme I (PtsI)